MSTIKTIYRYPTDDAVTDELEERQDNFKRAREVAVIKAMTSFDWHSGMDFGCGIGRNLPLLTKIMKRSWHRQLLAVDADAQRLEIAKKKTRRLSDGYVNIEYLPVSTENLYLHTGGNPFDLILCCQVFTHMQRAQLLRTLTVFHSVMAPGGVLVVCVPFHCLDIAGDYYHLIDTETSLTTNSVLREAVSEERFDDAVLESAKGILPVRAFKLPRQIPSVAARDLPIPVRAPVAFASLAHFEAISCLVYSIHQYDRGRPVIGDLTLKLRKRSS